MHTDHYSRSLIVKANISESYAAITKGFSHWWTPCEGEFDKVGDRIKFCFPPQVSFWVFEAKELIENKAVTLKCIEAYHVLLDQPGASETEWLDTTLQFQLETVSVNQTRVDFIHEGLTPNKRCYGVCEAGWNHFFVDSLYAYLDTGFGLPHSLS